MYICSYCIPSEDSKVYINTSSSQFEFDFFDQLNTDIRLHNDLGDVVYLTDGFSASTGHRSDFTENVPLDRYIDMPRDDELVTDIPLRLNKDSHVNIFGNKLLSLRVNVLAYHYTI